MSPPHGGFNPDDPKQQIVAEDIFDEYGGFLGEASIPDLLTNFSSIKAKKKSSKSKHRRRSLPESAELSGDHGIGPSSGDAKRKRSKEKRHKRKKRQHLESSSPETSEGGKHQKRSHRHNSRHSSSSEASDSDEPRRSKHSWHRHRPQHQHQHHPRGRHLD